MSAPSLSISVAQRPTVDVSLAQVAVAGWTGRDDAAVRHHIDELAAIGVAPPSRVPLYYRAAADMVTQAATIQVLGEGTSGEVEPILFDTGDEVLIGVGSDHTDRALEAHSVAAAKQICAKPVGTEFWVLDDIFDRLDTLELRSWIEEPDGWTLYQEGTLAAIRPLRALIDGCPYARGNGRLEPGTLLFCGTLGARGGVRPAPAFRMELSDPVAGRKLAHGYRIETLADGGLMSEPTTSWNKTHREFFTVDLDRDWIPVPGYPGGIAYKNLADDFDADARTGSRSRLVGSTPGCGLTGAWFMTIPRRSISCPAISSWSIRTRARKPHSARILMPAGLPGFSTDRSPASPVVCCSNCTIFDGLCRTAGSLMTDSVHLRPILDDAIRRKGSGPVAFDRVEVLARSGAAVERFVAGVDQVVEWADDLGVANVGDRLAALEARARPSPACARPDAVDGHRQCDAGQFFRRW